MARPALPILLKLADKELEDIQQQLHANRSAQTAVLAQVAHWQQEVAAAFSDALTQAEVHNLQAAHAYQHRAARAIEDLQAELTTLRATETHLRETLQTAYAKQQRYAQLAQAQAAQIKTKAARKAQANLDDLRRPLKG
jgi:flagellar biosynthesis chaperone FliJ